MIDIIEGAGAVLEHGREGFPVGHHRRPEISAGTHHRQAGSVKWVPLSVRTVWTRPGTASIRRQESARAARRVTFSCRVLTKARTSRSSIDRGRKRGGGGMELSLSGSNLGDADMEISDRVSFELCAWAQLRLGPRWQPRRPHDAAGSDAATSASGVRDRRLERVWRQSSSGSRVCLRKADHPGLFLPGQDRWNGASSASVGRSATRSPNSFHLAAVF